MTAQIDAAFNYNDLKGLENLKAGARQDNPEALKAVAQQFESMFISLIMQSMRDATDVMASDLESSYQTKFYRDMHDQQLSLSLSQSGGFGLADILYEQLSEAQNPARKNIFDIDVKGMDESIRPVLPSADFTTLDSHTQALVDQLSKSLVESKQIEITPNSEATALNSNELSTEQLTQPGKDALFNSPEEFIDKLLPIAEKAASALGLEPKYLLAQAALETGWGKFVIANEKGETSHNFFGIKADSRWQGEVAKTTTHEYIGGKRITVKEPFRAYESMEDSFQDYVDFIKKSVRYQSAVSASQNGDAYAQELQKAGYATDPNYAAKISRIANGEWFNKG